MSTTPSPQASPVSAAERLDILDVLRGFALLGILLMNIEYFQRALQNLLLGIDSSQTGVDYALAWAVASFIQGKFYTLFALLFGIGFSVFIARASEKGLRAGRLFCRRLLFLLLIGLVHLILIWGGDILHFYALTGFVLLLFMRSSAKRLLWFAGVIYLLPLLVTWLAAWGIDFTLQNPTRGPEMLDNFAQARAQLLTDIAAGEQWYASGTYWQVVQWRLYEFRVLMLGPGLLIFIPTIISLFLFGAALARLGVFTNLQQHQIFFSRCRLWGYGLGVPAALLWGLQGLSLDLMFPTYHSASLLSVRHFSNLALCLAYIGTVVWLYQRRNWLIRQFAAAGRMALTNYLMHSVVFTSLFYGYGVGIYGEFGRLAITGMALLLFALQLWFSHYWLSRFRFGPVEWLWRSLTYGSWQKLSKV